mmetsp:Transcript_2954/g.10228  ORF Transcript_2954/g.10228 Transcript_2954/m.10228 type:complete len:314 (+) Transcript_2954:998-1939(+)
MAGSSVECAFWAAAGSERSGRWDASRRLNFISAFASPRIPFVDSTSSREAARSCRNSSGISGTSAAVSSAVLASPSAEPPQMPARTSSNTPRAIERPSVGAGALRSSASVSRAVNSWLLMACQRSMASRLACSRALSSRSATSPGSGPPAEPTDSPISSILCWMSRTSSVLASCADLKVLFFGVPSSGNALPTASPPPTAPSPAPTRARSAWILPCSLLSSSNRSSSLPAPSTSLDLRCSWSSTICSHCLPSASSICSLLSSSRRSKISRYFLSSSASLSATRPSTLALLNSLKAKPQSTSSTPTRAAEGWPS